MSQLGTLSFIQMQMSSVFIVLELRWHCRLVASRHRCNQFIEGLGTRIVTTIGIAKLKTGKVGDSNTLNPNPNINLKFHSIKPKASVSLWI